MTKLCKTCNRELPLDKFNNSKHIPDGKFHMCKECVLNYKRQPKNVALKMYSSQLFHSKRRGHEPPIYTKYQFCKWLVDQQLWHDLIAAWQASGYQCDLIPSVDRIDNTLSYTMTNIKLMTWYDNRIKSDKQSDGTFPLRSGSVKPINMYSLDGVFLKEYQSITEAAIAMGNKSHGNIVKACQGKANKAYKHLWSYTNSPAVSMWTKDGKHVQDFISSRHAAHHMNSKCDSNILKVCRGKRQYALNHKWTLTHTVL